MTEFSLDKMMKENVVIEIESLKKQQAKLMKDLTEVTKRRIEFELHNQLNTILNGESNDGTQDS